MEDLIPLFIFIAIAVINILKVRAEKQGKGEQPSKPAGQTPPRHQPATLEEFFDEIARKFEPKPTALPDWPEHMERPDYRKQMDEFKHAQAFENEEPEAVIPTTPKPTPATAIKYDLPSNEAPQIHTTRKLAAFTLPAQSKAFAGLGHMRMAEPPLLRSATGHTGFKLKNRKQLKQALIASMVFGPPRAYDTSFDNTIKY